ncbi:hypothetical protein DTW90_12050 [Neorhizobium sp. P12A]|uniref:hypothetical protein n=1 Tax=Neorhizobium sp. P12A TaxID=2268027 RepID=UPI0011EE44A7|nr:hypothetical protein [Neorhizobium sp. P12A]KAA0698533.1 hypothetical protein DTW90_12050 [Neorhizobium sp. P12A]
MTAKTKDNSNKALLIGHYDPLVPTGRGSWVPYSQTSLEDLLFKFDRAYPEYTDEPREDVIAAWEAANEMMTDTQLLHLEEELKSAWAYEKRAEDEDFAAAYAVSEAIVNRMLKIEAHTLRGFKAKALAISWCHNGDEIDFGEETTDLQLVVSIINDLLAA